MNYRQVFNGYAVQRHQHHLECTKNILPVYSLEVVLTDWVLPAPKQSPLLVFSKEAFSLRKV